ncbi:hypothetical protein PS6_008192 [Mucor atramentarius]
MHPSSLKRHTINSKSSHWYNDEQTIQEKALEITYLEDKMEAKRLNDIQVGIPIMIRGQPILPSKILSIGGNRDEEEDEAIEEEVVDDDNLDETDRSASHLPTDTDDFHNHMYSQQQLQDDDEEDDMQPQTFNYGMYNPDESP